MLIKKNIFFILVLAIISSNSNAQSCEETGFQAMTYDRALLKSLELEGNKFDYSKIGHSYLSYFKPKHFAEIKSDEFLYYDEVNKASEELKNAVESYKNKCFYLTGMVDFGEYDFQKSLFPLLNFNGGFVFDARSVKGRGDWHMLPQKITIQILNKDLVKGLTMEKNEARDYLKKMKKKDGTVDRRIIHNFYFKPTNVNRTKKNNWVLYVNLVKVDAYKDKDGEKINESYAL